MSLRLTFVALACSFLSPMACLMADQNPGKANFFQQRAQHVMALQHGLPAAAPRTSTKSELQLSVVHSNVFMGGINDEELLLLDGETSVLNVRYRWQASRCWQVNVDSEWIAHSGGWFDNSVVAWHQFFNLPNAKRDEVELNRLLFSYIGPDQQERTLSQSSSGIGDLQLQAQRLLNCKPGSTIARAGIKVPLGDAATFSGGGELDYFVDIQSPWVKPTDGSRWQWAASAGLLKPGPAQDFPVQKELVGFGTAGFNYTVNHRLQLLAQLDWYTRLYKSQIREIGQESLQLSLGLRYFKTEGSTIELNFTEDASIDTAPDIGVRLAWTIGFN